MTFREKLKKEHPENIKPIYCGGCLDCPSDYGYEEHPNCNIANGDCTACWDRKIPGTDRKNNYMKDSLRIGLFSIGVVLMILGLLMTIFLFVNSVSAAEADHEVDIVAMSEEIQSCSLQAAVDKLLGQTPGDMIARMLARPDPKDVEMLALVIYQEVGGDMHCDECRRRVADVVLNRVADDRFPDNIYDVLVQPGQYGKLSWTGLVWASRANSIWEAPAVDRAYRIAEEVLMGKHSELYGAGYVWQAGFVQGKDNIYCCGHYFGR